MITDKIDAAKTRRKVIGIAAAIWSTTGSLRITVFPKSPVKAFVSHKKYRAGGGTSSCRVFVSSAMMTSFFGSVDSRIPANGSPE